MWPFHSSSQRDDSAKTSSDISSVGKKVDGDYSVINAGNIESKRKFHQRFSPQDKITSTPQTKENKNLFSGTPDESNVETLSRDGVVLPPYGVNSSSASKTPARVGRFSSTMRTPGSNHGSSERFRALHATFRTPSGPRVNPFDSQISAEVLQGPTFSPSVFSTVLSPSQEQDNGRFWSLDQQAHLFPAQISDDSPWKQELASTRLDPELENRTQEAIDLYFSRHSHQITSPDDVVQNTRSVIMNTRTSHLATLGESPHLSSCGKSSVAQSPVQHEQSVMESKILAGKSVFNLEANKSASNSVSQPPAAKKFCSQWAQTELTFPSELPREVEDILSKFFTFKDDQSAQPKIQHLHSPVVQGEEGNNSTLRRKLFPDGNCNDDTSDDDVSAKDISPHECSLSSSEDNKENSGADNYLPIMPGTLMMTPTSQRIEDRSINKPLSWSVSPVSRKSCSNGPVGSTPSKS